MSAKLTKFMSSNNKIFKLILKATIIEVEIDKKAFEVLYIKKDSLLSCLFISN
jgi:hypothetical protein